MLRTSELCFFFLKMSLFRFYFFHRNLSLVFQRLLPSLSLDLLLAEKLALTQTLCTSAGSVNLLMLSSLPSCRMSQKSLRPPFGVLRRCVVGVCELGEGRDSVRPVDPESVWRGILDGEGEAITDPKGLGVFGVLRCCALLGLGFNKSSRIEVSPIRSVRKERLLEAEAAWSGGEGV